MVYSASMSTYKKVRDVLAADIKEAKEHIARLEADGGREEHEYKIEQIEARLARYERSAAHYDAEVEAGYKTPSTQRWKKK